MYSISIVGKQITASSFQLMAQPNKVNS